MKRRTWLVVLVVGLPFIIGATASAQSSIELTGTLGAYRAGARPGAQVLSEYPRFQYGCTAQYADFGNPYPLHLKLEIFVDDILQDSEEIQGTFYVEATVDADFMLTTDDHHVTCDAYMDYDVLHKEDYAPGLPDSEFSVFWDWHPTWPAASFVAYINPAGSRFSGRQVQEWDLGGGSDSCWYPESVWPQGGQLTPGDPWTVQEGNGYGFDVVGFRIDPELGDPVVYYRNKGQAPCGLQMHQLMEMSLPGTESHAPFTWAYQINVLRAGMTNSTVWASRDGVEAERIYP